MQKKNEIKDYIIMSNKIEIDQKLMMKKSHKYDIKSQIHDIVLIMRQKLKQLSLCIMYYFVFHNVIMTI